MVAGIRVREHCREAQYPSITESSLNYAWKFMGLSSKAIRTRIGVISHDKHSPKP